ncbi:hypothetical protein ABZ753_28685 [Streptomyces griseoincarnatus]
MSKGRHRGERAWGLLPPTGRDIRTLPTDFAVFSFRLFGTAIAITVGVAAVGVFGGEEVRTHPAVVPLFTAASVLSVVGFFLARYIPSATRHAKTYAADTWQHQIQSYRVERLAQREEDLMARITELKAEFEEEKIALEEIQEERIEQERMMSYIRGMTKSPEIAAYLANPRNRLRAVPDLDEESA